MVDVDIQFFADNPYELSHFGLVDTVTDDAMKRGRIKEAIRHSKSNEFIQLTRTNCGGKSSSPSRDSSP